VTRRAYLIMRDLAIGLSCLLITRLKYQLECKKSKQVKLRLAYRLRLRITNAYHFRYVAVEKVGAGRWVWFYLSYPIIDR
jgi:hypothetical protein